MVVGALAGVDERIVRQPADQEGLQHRCPRDREEGVVREDSAERLMEHVVQILEDSLTPGGIDQWLRARNRMLDGRTPLDLIEEGNLARVEEAALAFVDGGYA